MGNSFPSISKHLLLMHVSTVSVSRSYPVRTSKKQITAVCDATARQCPVTVVSIYHMVIYGEQIMFKITLNSVALMCRYSNLSVNKD